MQRDPGLQNQDHFKSMLWAISFFQRVAGEMRTEVGGRFKMEGTYVYLRLIHVDVW